MCKAVARVGAGGSADPSFMPLAPLFCPLAHGAHPKQKVCGWAWKQQRRNLPTTSLLDMKIGPYLTQSNFHSGQKTSPQRNFRIVPHVYPLFSKRKSFMKELHIHFINGQEKRSNEMPK